ncbi:MAG: hypothetical protein M3N68_06100 [Actinomycetota bacterium]|nr:hypothetical protein [Actinomycetota bacterium]
MAGAIARLTIVVLFALLNAAILPRLDAAPPPPTPGETAAAVASAPTPSQAACAPAPLAQRAGQVLVVGLPGVTTSSDGRVAEALDVHVGGVLIAEPNIESVAQVGQLVADIRARAARPLIVSSDEESGRVSRFRELVGTSPSPRRLAADSSPDAVRRMAKRIGSRLVAVGVNLDLAPVVDLDAGPALGVVGDRSFSDDPATAATYALAYAEGLAAAGVAPTAKHFPGHGRTRVDTHVRMPTVAVTLEELRATDLKPFDDLIRAGVPVVMMNHVAYTALDGGLPASLSPKAYRLLRDMGFRGVALTDSVDMGAVNPRWSFAEAAVRAVRAGADGVVSSNGTQTRAMRDALVRAVTTGRLDERRLNEAAGRVLTLAGGDAAAFTCEAVTLPALAGASPRGP